MIKFVKKKNPGFGNAEYHKMLGIPEEFDYPEIDDDTVRKALAKIENAKNKALKGRKNAGRK